MDDRNAAASDKGDELSRLLSSFNAPAKRVPSRLELDTFNSLIEQARKVARQQTRGGAEAFFESAEVYACDHEMEEQRALALLEAAQYELARQRFYDARRILERLKFFQEMTHGPGAPELARTYYFLGICHRHLCDTNVAISCLRAAVLRYQCAASLDVEGLAESLFELSRCYRDANRLHLSRICLKQALVVMTPQQAPNPSLRASMLDEFGRLLCDRHEDNAAVWVFRQALMERQRAFGQRDPSVVDSLIGLGMACYALREFEVAECAFTEAAIVAQLSSSADPAKPAGILEKLAGTLRVQARFAEAGMVEDAAKELISGAQDIFLYDRYRKDMESGFYAQKTGDEVAARDFYQHALEILEHLHHRNSADRISILVRLRQLAMERQQAVQAATLELEIEEELAELFGVRRMSRIEACLRMARLFVAQGKFVAADGFLVYAAEHCRKIRDIASLSVVLEEHAEIMRHLRQDQASQRMAKLARRLVLTAGGEESFTQSRRLLDAHRYLQPVSREKQVPEISATLTQSDNPLSCDSENDRRRGRQGAERQPAGHTAIPEQTDRRPADSGVDLPPDRTTIAGLDPKATAHWMIETRISTDSPEDKESATGG